MGFFIPLNTLQFYNCNEPIVSSECDYCIVLIAAKNMATPNRSCFFLKKKKKGLYILHFYPKSTRVVSLQNNTSITGISEPKLDSSILNSEVDIKGYDLV